MTDIFAWMNNDEMQIIVAVSDNSATGVPLLGRGEELARKYVNTRSNIIPDMVFRIARS